VDALVFVVAFSAGMALSEAHLVSFGAAAVLNYLTSLKPAIVRSQQGHGWRLYGRLLAVSLLAVFLRGGVLSLLTDAWRVPAQASIVVAALATLAMLRVGYRLALFSNTWRPSGEPQWRAVAVGLVGAAVLLRLVYFGQLELLPEETYYWNYSRHLDLSYLDHPPMVAWLIRAGTVLWGNTESGVRLGALCCAVIASFYQYRLTRNLFGEPSALVSLVLMQLLPFLFCVGLLMTPDAPLTASWTATLYYLERALVAGVPGAWWGAGIALGLGLISKYTIAMLVPAMLIFVLLDRQSRHWLRHWLPYTALCVGLILFSPVILWNAQHEWASFTFQTARRLAERPRFSLHNLIASAFVLLTPPGFLSLEAALHGNGVGGAVSSEESRKWRFLQTAVLTPLAVYFVFSLRHEVKLDWTGTVWIAAVPALASAIVSWGKQPVRGVRAWARAAWGPTLLTFLVLYGAALHYFVLGLPGVGYSEHMEVSPAGWRDLGNQVAALATEMRRRTGTPPLVVGMDRYAIASELAFYAPDQTVSVGQTTASHLFGGDGLMYEAWFPIQQLRGRTLLLIALKPQDLTSAQITSCATRLDPPQEGVLTRNGTIIHRYYYRVLYGYRPPARPDASTAAIQTQRPEKSSGS
jgi:dolichol-phosphate mannosyltransferase